MRIAALRIFVDDLDAARRFYREQLGLPLQWDEGGAVAFGAGTELILEQASDDEDRALVGRFVGCSFGVPDVTAACKALSAKGVTFLGPAEQQPWGGRLAHFTDPSGNVLTLVGD